MKIKFRYLNVFYWIVTIIAPICVLIQIFEPDIGKYSETVQSISLGAIVILGLSGFLFAVFEKTKIIGILYSEKDKNSVFYKATKCTGHASNKRENL